MTEEQSMGELRRNVRLMIVEVAILAAVGGVAAFAFAEIEIISIPFAIGAYLATDRVAAKRSTGWWLGQPNKSVFGVIDYPKAGNQP
jgi:hypothetical protein